VKDGQWDVFGETAMTPLPGREEMDERLGEDALEEVDGGGPEVNDEL
jgi:hypothetical protein